ncbi:protein FAM216A-like [Eleginops maclovinus]|uniref:protein FAM216A-like n=1 Tax=Eleginops maclovinus TaxID=56733 RepID=UPI0030808C38
MRKQVSFADSQRSHRLHQDEALQSSIGMDASNIALNDAGVNLNYSLKINPPAATCDSQHQRETTITIPKSLTAGPHLKHAALSPAQRKYLYSVAASYSPAHVRQLITRHYMNVLHRCIPADGSHVVSSVAEERDRHPSEVHLSAKHRKKIKSGARNSGKPCLAKTSNRKARLSKTTATKPTKTKKRKTKPPKLTRKSPGRARIRLLEKDKEEEGPDDFLSECFSSLSMEGWEDDTLSDL